MNEKTAARIVRALSVEDSKGFHPPGSGRWLYQTAVDGRKLLIVSRGDEFDIATGRAEYEVTVVAIPAKLLLSFTWWMITRYWFLGTWCGLKTWLWDRAVGVLFNAHAETRPRAEGDQSRPTAS